MSPIKNLTINLNTAPAAALAQVAQPLPQSYHKPAWQTCLEVAAQLARLVLAFASVAANVWPW